MQEGNENKESKLTNCLIIVDSYHHNNTAKIAYNISEVLHATVKAPAEAIPEELKEYELIGFGAGIDSGKHYKPLLDFVDRLPEVHHKRCFIFSTSAIQGEAKVAKDHSILRNKLQSKGYIILGEFSCQGLNTNSFLKYFGGMNRGKPDSKDLNHAVEFALRLVNEEM